MKMKYTVSFYACQHAYRYRYFASAIFVFTEKILERSAHRQSKTKTKEKTIQIQRKTLKYKHSQTYGFVVVVVVFVVIVVGRTLYSHSNAAYYIFALFINYRILRNSPKETLNGEYIVQQAR